MRSGRPLASVIAVVTGGALPGFLTGGVSVQLRHDLAFGEAELGLAVGAFFAAAALSSAVLGRTAERLGPTAAMRASATCSAAALLGVAAGARSYTTLLLWLALGGVANALAQPAANLFIATTIAPERLGTAFAVKQSGIPAATLLGGLAVPTIALTVGWRWAFLAGAVLPVVGGLTIPATGRTRRRRGEARPTSEPLPFGPLVVLAVGIGFGAAAAGTLGAFLVNAAVEAGIGAGPAGLLVSAGSAIGIAVRLAVGVRADRRTGGHLRTVTLMLLAGSVAYVAYATQIGWVLVVATPLAFGAGWGWPGLFNLAIVRAHPSAPGAASGITQTGTYLGAVLGPVVFGAVAEHASYGAAWLVAAGCALAGAVTIALGRRLVRARRDAR